MTIMPSAKKKYRPLGTKLLVQLPDPNKRNGLLVLPENAREPGPQTATVLAIGGAVNEEKFKVAEGDVVILSFTPTCLIPVNKEERIILVERHDVVAVVEEEEGKTES